ncbi:hypothetical protein [Martelella mediterranea]|uniref:Uncharacterized protein n=1 Tax=Martelella mediterranea TaxID=293089 RepID=A0A4R3NEF8_9HYPH|nr:hypothetical protein [Martelella mediterranea]TCT27952.1 hypothetical protein EDC90_10696 [Martelella mediterranea]
MAKHAPNTPPAANEDSYFPSSLTSSPVALLFSAMLARLEHFVAAEQEIDGVSDVFDPAYAKWLRDAEDALDHVTNALTVLQYLPVLSEGDDALLQFSAALMDIFGSETAPEASAARVKAVCLPDILHFNAVTSEGQQAQQLLSEGFSHLVSVQALALFHPNRFASDDRHVGDTAAIPA